MTVSIASPVTGVALTGLTSPTYTIVADTPPVANAKKYIVSALGGTQTNVRTHSVSDPFEITIYKPVTLKTLPNANPVTGSRGTIPKNVYTAIIKKGVYVDADLNVDRATLKLSFEVPAGADAQDAINIRAMLAFLFGVVGAEPNDFGDLLVTGVL
jgi:hypothetical protein